MPTGYLFASGKAADSPLDTGTYIFSSIRLCINIGITRYTVGSDNQQLVHHSEKTNNDLGNHLFQLYSFF